MAITYGTSPRTPCTAEFPKEHRENLEESLLLTDQSGAAVFLGDLRGKITEVNRQARELLGYTKAELVQMDYTQLVPPDWLDFAVTSFKQLLRKHTFSARDVILVKKSGEEVPVDITARIVEQFGQKILKASVRDVTERKKYEDELRKAKERLERLVQERTADLMMKNKQLETVMEEQKGYQKRLKTKRCKLEMKAKQLTQLNAALKVLLKQRDADKRDIEEKIMMNVKELVLPHLERLKIYKHDQKSLVELSIIESNLKNILSPFTHKLSARFLGLTHREIQIAAMIKEGKGTKEMAEIMNVSQSAIKLHRYHIRKKLSLIDQKVNLRSYLSSLPNE